MRVDENWPQTCWRVSLLINSHSGLTETYVNASYRFIDRQIREILLRIFQTSQINQKKVPCGRVLS